MTYEKHIKVIEVLLEAGCDMLESERMALRELADLAREVQPKDAAAEREHCESVSEVTDSICANQTVADVVERERAQARAEVEAKYAPLRERAREVWSDLPRSIQKLFEELEGE